MRMNPFLLASTVLATAGPARAFADLNFDATTVEPDAGFETIPAGWYNVKIDESSMKPTKDGAGAYLELRFNVIDGQYANRKLFSRLNLKNANATTVEIAQKQLSAICHAVGVLRPGKSEELHGIPLKAKVKVRAASGDYEASNEFTAYKNINEAVDMAGAGGTPAAAPAAGGVPEQPWAAPPAAGLQQSQDPAPAGQPWAAPPTEAAPPATPAAPPVAPVAPVAPHDPIAAAVADGWIKHPNTAGYHYKGQEVKADADLAAMYPAPAPTPPAAPTVPTVPGAPDQAQVAPPPWAAG
jgi:hypothetical protein